ncbi:hypothetical protein Scep_009631 [Stephania cephalantha]|uniref:Uncharacterized protein n=1 Tax=Stephania cephalantha TaxID=152367 RepID=A0AAP0JVU5_9MAGN
MQNTWTTCNLVSADGFKGTRLVMNQDKVGSIRRTLDRLRPSEVRFYALLETKCCI